MGWSIATGTSACAIIVVGGSTCIQDAEGDYSIDETCTFSYTGNATLTQTQWNFEESYDGIKTAGGSTFLSSSDFPMAVGPHTSTFVFTSDSSNNYAGFKICAPNAPTPAPTIPTAEAALTVVVKTTLALTGFTVASFNATVQWVVKTSLAALYNVSTSLIKFGAVTVSSRRRLAAGVSFEATVTTSPAQQATVQAAVAAVAADTTALASQINSGAAAVGIIAAVFITSTPPVVVTGIWPPTPHPTSPPTPDPTQAPTSAPTPPPTPAPFVCVPGLYNSTFSTTNPVPASCTPVEQLIRFALWRFQEPPHADGRHVVAQHPLFPPRITPSARWLGKNNRLLQGVLLTQTRAARRQCDPADQFDTTKQFCYYRPSQESDEAFGVDPVFVPSSDLYNSQTRLPALKAALYNRSELLTPKAVPYGFTKDMGAAEEVVVFGGSAVNTSGSTGRSRAAYLSSKEETEGEPRLFPVFFDINLAGDRALEMVAYLKDGFYLDGQTRSLTVSMLLANQITDLMTVVMVTFSMNNGGQVELERNVKTFRLEYYSSESRDLTRAVLEGVFFMAVVYQFATHAVTIKRKGLGHFFSDFSRLLDICNCIIMVMQVVTFARLAISSAAFRPALHEPTALRQDPNTAVARWFWLGPGFANVDGALSSAIQITELIADYVSYCTLSTVLMTVRLLQLLDFQPRLGVITRTLKRGGLDLLHFFLVFFLVLCAFAALGNLSFGGEIHEFRSFSASIGTLMAILMGDMDVDNDLRDHQNSLSGVIFMWSFICIAFFILINVLLAIIVDAYVEVKDASKHSETLLDDLRVVVSQWQRGRRRRADWRARVKDITTRASAEYRSTTASSQGGVKGSTKVGPSDAPEFSRRNSQAAVAAAVASVRRDFSLAELADALLAARLRLAQDGLKGQPPPPPKPPSLGQVGARFVRCSVSGPRTEVYEMSADAAARTIQVVIRGSLGRSQSKSGQRSFRGVVAAPGALSHLAQQRADTQAEAGASAAVGGGAGGAAAAMRLRQINAVPLVLVCKHGRLEQALVAQLLSFDAWGRPCAAAATGAAEAQTRPLCDAGRDVAAGVFQYLSRKPHSHDKEEDTSKAAMLQELQLETGRRVLAAQAEARAKQQVGLEKQQASASAQQASMTALQSQLELVKRELAAVKAAAISTEPDRAVNYSVGLRVHEAPRDPVGARDVGARGSGPLRVASPGDAVAPVAEAGAFGATVAAARSTQWV
jgi:hypothetical protein